jgi:hypothetical protein
MIKVCMILKKEWLSANYCKGCCPQSPPRLLRPWEVINRKTFTDLRFVLRYPSDVARGGARAPPGKIIGPPWENSKLDCMVKHQPRAFFLVKTRALNFSSLKSHGFYGPLKWFFYAWLAPKMVHRPNFFWRPGGGEVVRKNSLRKKFFWKKFEVGPPDFFGAPLTGNPGYATALSM